MLYGPQAARCALPKRRVTPAGTGPSAAQLPLAHLMAYQSFGHACERLPASCQLPDSDAESIHVRRA